MMYFIARFGSKKRIIKILGLLSVYALLITVLRYYDTITYNADLQRAGAVFCLDTKVDLWIGNELVFCATPSYQGAGLVSLLDGEGVLLVFFPIIIGNARTADVCKRFQGRIDAFVIYTHEKKEVLYDKWSGLCNIHYDGNVFFHVCTAFVCRCGSSISSPMRYNRFTRASYLA